MDHQPVLSFLNSNSLPYQLVEHPPVFTVEEAKQHRDGMEDAVHAKNLFLRDSKKKDYYLLTTEADKEFTLAEIRKMIKARNLSFASPDRLQEVLQLEPGSVSPYGLLNDVQKEVIFLIDRDIWEAEKVAFHPNVNTMTLVLTGEDFQISIKKMGYVPIMLEI